MPTSRSSVEVRVDPVEVDALRWAMIALDDKWREAARLSKSTSTAWALPGWYDDLRRLYERALAAQRAAVGGVGSTTKEDAT